MKPLKEKISITVDSDLLEKAKLFAEEDDRSLSQYINLVLKEHIKKGRTRKSVKLFANKNPHTMHLHSVRIFLFCLSADFV